MRGKAVLAAMVLGLLALTAACSGADAVLDPQDSTGGGTPPSTVDTGAQALGNGDAHGALGSR